MFHKVCLVVLPPYKLAVVSAGRLAGNFKSRSVDKAEQAAPIYTPVAVARFLSFT